MVNNNNNDDGVDDDPIDDWASTDLTALNEKGQYDVANKKDVNKSVPVRNKTTPVKKKER